MKPFRLRVLPAHKTQSSLKFILQACRSLALNESYSPLFIMSTQATPLLQIYFRPAQEWK